MSPENEKKFLDRWPKWFGPRFRFECGDGWLDLIWDLCERIEDLDTDADMTVAQVKEKFGGLRFYVLSATQEAFDLIDDAEDESYLVCESCGSRDEVETSGSWLRTLCKKCI